MTIAGDASAEEEFVAEQHPKIEARLSGERLVILGVQDNSTIHQHLPPPPEIRITCEVGVPRMCQEAQFVLVMTWRGVSVAKR